MILKRTHEDSIIKVVEIDTDLFNELFNPVLNKILQVGDSINLSRRIVVEYIVLLKEEKKEIETLNL